jgi:hypothetical protein
MDADRAGTVWEPLLMGEGTPDGVLTGPGGAAVHVAHDGWFPVRVSLGDDGSAVGFEIDLDPYAADVESFRGLEPGEDPEPAPDTGPPVWAPEVRIALDGPEVVVGDPAAVPDGGTELLTVAFPAGGGTLAVGVLLDGDRQVLLTARWSA